MNAQEFSPDSNSAGKLNKNQTIGCFLFVTDQQFTKTAEKSVWPQKPNGGPRSPGCAPVPSFPWSAGFFPTAFRASGAFTMQPSRLCHSQPTPSNSSCFPVLWTISLSKNPACLFLKILVVAAGCSVFWGVLLSIGSPFVKHRIFPLIPVVCTIVFFRRRVYAYIFCTLLAAAGVSHPLRPPRTYLILSHDL